MANIIPPEYFGIYGLGSSLQGIGQDIQQVTERKRAKSREELELMLALNPNNRMALIQNAIDSKLLPPSALEDYQATPQEKLAAGTPWDQLTPEEQFILSPTGVTPELARRGAVADVEGAEQGVDLGDIQLTEARAAQQRREQYEASLNTPWFRQAAGIPEGTEVTPGSVEAARLGQQLTAENLDNIIREAKANHAEEREIAELEALRARTAHYNFQLSQLEQAGADDGTLAWIKGISENTGWSPNHINAALNPESGMAEAVRDNIIGDISDYQESLRAGIQQSIREGNSVAGQTLSQLVEWQKAGIQIFAPEDPVWKQFTADALNEIGIPAAFMPAEPGSWFFNVGGEDARVLMGEDAENHFERAAAMVGETTAEAPSIDQNSANALAPELVDHHGSVQEAIDAVTSNEAMTQANKDLILTSLRTLGGSTPEPEATTPTQGTATPATDRPATQTEPDSLASPRARQDALSALTTTLSNHRMSGARNTAEILQRNLDKIEDINTRIHDTQDAAISSGSTHGVYGTRIRALERRRDKLLETTEAYAERARKAYVNR